MLECRIVGSERGVPSSDTSDAHQEGYDTPGRTLLVRVGVQF